ncbi:MULTISPECIES: DUF4142 domain-containing protein [Olivibacter]|jgi:predicted outer membrane protein|uniref:DUF4142 domain-containing protein n=2 Tax=Olivibacter TaxID=376469 RepID=A0ABV6HJD0_9SPHI|nr:MULTISPECIES: DUF4142 domain-containing protein [Olivibacter]MCL4637806.1 DUF4142 domain-containing protein [Olivibacter sp. UJ_SKK_5.1]MDM8175024.1 DUF4142 domain-containing protein [Olivibacter sp. 47]MDX3913292.1 DUF4142 domain-containing protein [Pseudosphingobacterium sp.]QEL01804.1 DUF4142 domain-containing protein [Olivibacter sp. LS-1]
MNRKIALFGLSTFACVLSMSSCTSVGEHKASAELYYTNITKADTEEYRFYRTVYQLANEEIEFANIISQRGSNASVKSLATNLSTQYKDVLAKVQELATKSDVLIPFPAMHSLELPAGLDSAQASILDKEFLKHSLHNQEAILHQFEGAARTTDVSVRKYAKEALPVLEKSIEETKTLL